MTDEIGRILSAARRAALVASEDEVKRITRAVPAASVPFLFKQWGVHNVFGKRVGKGRAGRVLDGRTWDQYPDANRLQHATP